LILVLPKERHRRSALAADLHQHLYCWNFRAINNLIRVAGGQPLHNRYEPMFGPRTHGWLRPVRRLLGFESYYRWGQWTGRLRGHLELVVHARPAQGLGAGPPSPAAAGAGNSDPAWRPAQPESR
jgi:hypothetical protein